MSVCLCVGKELETHVRCWVDGEGEWYDMAKDKKGTAVCGLGHVPIMAVADLYLKTSQSIRLK